MRRLEKRGTGVYSSSEENVVYDDTDPTRRYGTLIARLVRHGRPSQS